MSIHHQSFALPDIPLSAAEPNQDVADQLHEQIAALLQELHVCKTTLQTLAGDTAGMDRQTYTRRILVKSHGKYILLQASEIDWIEAWGDHVRLHCSAAVHIHRYKIGDFETHLDPSQFLRIGRSAIVNIDRVRLLEPMNHGDFLVVLQDSTQLNLSRHYRGRLSALLGHPL